jgi:hypothetical protein
MQLFSIMAKYLDASLLQTFFSTLGKAQFSNVEEVAKIQVWEGPDISKRGSKMFQTSKRIT